MAYLPYLISDQVGDSLCQPLDILATELQTSQESGTKAIYGFEDVAGQQPSRISFTQSLLQVHNGKLIL